MGKIEEKGNKELMILFWVAVGVITVSVTWFQVEVIKFFLL